METEEMDGEHIITKDTRILGMDLQEVLQHVKKYQYYFIKICNQYYHRVISCSKK